MALRTFPISVALRDRTVLLVGGGETMLRKARLVAPFGGRLRVIHPAPSAELEALAHGVERRAFAPADLEDAVLVFADPDDSAVDAAGIAALAQARGIPVNVPDRPELSSFITPGIIDRDPVTIAISSGGAAPVVVRRLRERIEAAVPSGFGALVRLMGDFRNAVKATRHGETARRRFWEAVVDGPVGGKALAGDLDGARASLLQAVNDPAYGQLASGSVALVGAGPGDPDLLTVRALRVMQDADVVVHDKLVDDRVLSAVRRDARRIYVGKSRGNHALSQEAINALLVDLASEGHRVVRLKGGDPFVFGRGGEEVEALRAAGIGVEVVPGITAAVGCGAATTIPLTHRGAAQGVTFVTGHGKDGAPDLDWSALARLRHTLVIYMGLTRLGLAVERLSAEGLPGDTPAALIENGTRPEQTLAVGTLAALPELAAAHGMTGPVLIVIGDVVRLADPARITDLAAPALAAAR